MFASGLVKLLSGDATWRSLTALQFHYETQLLPTPLAWYAHQLPPWFHELSAALMFGVELFVPTDVGGSFGFQWLLVPYGLPMFRTDLGLIWIG